MGRHIAWVAGAAFVTGWGWAIDPMWGIFYLILYVAHLPANRAIAWHLDGPGRAAPHPTVP